MKKWIVGILAFLITIGAAIYQKYTGPTYPKTISFIHQDKAISYTLPRSHETTDDCPVVLDKKFKTENGFLYYKRYPTNDAYTKIPFSQSKDGGRLTAFLPKQPASGKLIYYIELYDRNKLIFSNADNQNIIRFKGHVPPYILIPHIIFMFFAMFFSTYTALRIVARLSYKRFIWITLALLILGGLFFGPIVQKYAFGFYWTGIPFGWDLTDNKTLIAFIFWVYAVIRNMKHENKNSVFVAAIVTLIIFSIPHSMFGSQLDYSTGKMTQGIIWLFL